ncbi:hypothetical protein SprV_0401668600 [Sparganum proliferum]
MPRPRRLDVAKIRQASTAEALCREIRTCYTTRADGEVSNQWSSLMTSVYGAAEKILGYTQRRRSDWISGRTLQLSAQTAQARSRNDDCFRQLRKMKAKSARDDRKQYWAEIATSMEQASNVGDTRKLYCLIRQVSVPCDPPSEGEVADAVLVRNNLSQPFGIRSGVRQGCILSPILFNYAIDWILGRALRENDGVEFAPGHRLTDLDYADDIALLASSFGDLQSMVSRVNEVAQSVGLSINAGKTKVLSSCIPDQEKAPLRIDGCQLEEVDSFKYLGARLLPNGQSKDDIVSRIGAARWVFSSLRKCLWILRELSIATTIRVYRASVRSVLLYGCEFWALRVEDERKLEVFDHHCLRTILRVKFTDLVSNETVRARCDNIARITQAIQERRLRWFGHVLRRPPQELSVTALDSAPLPHWRRRRGGQFKTWLETVRQDMEVVLGPSVFGLRRWRREWVELSRSAAADRHAWRGTVRDIIDAG